jgi:glycosyltransferase involved in cell wall biosynthesis
MKIVYIIHGTYNTAGMERTLSIKANYFADVLGYEVFIITTDQRNRPAYYILSKKIRCVDLDVNFDQYYNKPLLISIFSFLIKQFICKVRLTRKLHELKADIVISMMGRIISFLPKINDGSKKIFEYHFNRYVREQMLENSTWFKKLVYRIRANSELKNVEKLDSFVVLTHEDASMWGNFRNIQVIPNAISFFTKENAKLDNKIVISVGRFEHQKGYDMLLSIWKPVVKKYPDWKLIVYGDGSKRDSIMAQVNKEGLNESLIIKDPVSNIESALLDASIYLMTSRYEGFPMVLVEAMACGLPVVSFRCPCGPADIIRHNEDGFLIENGDVEKMSEYLSLLIKNEVLRKKAGELARVNITRFTQDVVMSKWEALFKDLIAKK